MSKLEYIGVGDDEGKCYFTSRITLGIEKCL